MAKREERWAWLFIAPPFLGFVLFMAYPICFALLASTSRWTGMNSLMGNLSGLRNYAEIMADPKFWKSLGTTVIYLIGIPIGMILGILIAMGLNRGIKGKRVLTTMYYVPVVSSLVAVSILWAWVFNYDYGLFNTIIKALTGRHGPNWLGDEHMVKVAMIIFMTWKGLGGTIILYLAGLQNIPKDYYEAAKIDGGSGWECFWKITLPTISPMILASVVYTVVDSFVDPGNKVMTIVLNKSTNWDHGYSAAMAWAYFAIIGVCLAIIVAILNKVIYYEVE